MIIGQMDVNWDHRTITGPKGTVKLTPRERDLLEQILENKGNAVSRKELLTKAWGWDNAQDIKTKTVDVHIGRVRTKFTKAGLDPRLIQTVRGEGYRFVF